MMQVAQGFGLLLGTLAMNPKTAQTIASIVVLAFTLVGGYFVRGELLKPHTCTVSLIVQQSVTHSYRSKANASPNVSLRELSSNSPASCFIQRRYSSQFLPSSRAL